MSFSVSVLQIESALDESIMIRSYVESLASGMLIVPRVLPTEISDTLLSVAPILRPSAKLSLMISSCMFALPIHKLGASRPSISTVSH